METSNSKIMFHNLFCCKWLQVTYLPSKIQNILYFKVISDNFPARKFRKIFLKYGICPTKSKLSVCISDYMQSTFFFLERFLKKLADEQCSFITKGSIYQTQLCGYNLLLPWEWINLKSLAYWKYLLCLIFADTAFLLGTVYSVI